MRKEGEVEDGDAENMILISDVFLIKHCSHLIETQT